MRSTGRGANQLLDPLQPTSPARNLSPTQHSPGPIVTRTCHLANLPLQQAMPTPARHRPEYRLRAHLRSMASAALQLDMKRCGWPHRSLLHPRGPVTSATTSMDSAGRLLERVQQAGRHQHNADQGNGLANVSDRNRRQANTSASATAGTTRRRSAAKGGADGRTCTYRHDSGARPERHRFDSLVLFAAALDATQLACRH